jgi:transmembrane sensor
MPAPHPSPDARLIEEASAWFSKLNTRQVSSDTLEGFRVWRQGEGHREAYAEVERAWRRSSALEGEAYATDAVAEAIARGRARRAATGTRAWRPFALIGVGLLLVISLGVGVAVQSGLFGRSYVTGVGEQRLVQLDDGSHIRLDTDTRLVVQLSGARRVVRLERGQALFEVAHDAARPFIVEAGAADVRALGTQFDVRRDAGHVQVTLLQGRIEVRRGSDAGAVAVVLHPGEQVVANGGLGRPGPIDVAAATSWTDGRLLFHAIPLRQAIAEMNRYSRRRIVLAAPGLADEAVTGAFDTTNIDGFVSAVSGLHALRVERDDKEIRLLPGNS